MPRLLAVTVSTRPNRKGPLVARWFHDLATTHGRFDVTPVDLGDLGLPLYDEPEHPRLRRYQHDHTKAWSAHVAAADAVAFVMPEYNYSPPPSFTNALDYLLAEWAYAAVGFVTYGGISGGLRALQAARLQVCSLRMVPVVESVSIQMFTSFISSDGSTFTPDAKYATMGTAMLDELRRVSDALRALRSPDVD